MTEPRTHRLSILVAEDVPDVVSVLSEAFHDYPVMRFVLGDEPEYDDRLRTLVTFFVMARVLRGELILGVAEGGSLAAAALASRPGSRPTPRRLAELREETWGALGAEARGRYEVFGEVAGRFSVGVDHLHLNMIGVRRHQQGLGLGAQLLDHLHARSAADPTSAGVSLSTEVESNVSLYRRFGYRILGSAPVAAAFMTWGMFRPDDPTLAPGELAASL